MTTIEPAQAGNTAQTMPEFGRVKDVERLFGVKRGILYRWIGAGKVKSVCIREDGNAQGVRLIHLASVRDYIQPAYIKFTEVESWLLIHQ